MSPARETTAERPRRKRRRATKAAGVSTNYPWSDPKHGIVFLKKHTVRDADGVQVESNLIIASRLHDALIRFGSVRLGQTIEEGTLPADSRAGQRHAMQSGGKASASMEQYRRWTATSENFVEFMLPPSHPEKVRLRALKRALAENSTSYRVTEPTDLDAVMQFLTLMSAPWEKEYSADAEYGGVLVRGRGCGYSTFLIKRNYINPMYCPVVAMVVWLKVLNDVAPGHKNGPLFPALRDDHNDFIFDEDGHMQIISETQHSRRWDLAARYVGRGLELSSTHAKRRSVVKWGALQCSST